MDIYTANNAANRIYSYICSYPNRPPNMYKSTYEKLINLRKTCNSISSCVSTILEDNSPDCLADVNIHSMSDAVVMMACIQRFLYNYVPTTSCDDLQVKLIVDMCKSISDNGEEFLISDRLDQINNKLDQIYQHINVVDNNSSSTNATCADKSRIMSEYYDMFKNLSEFNYSYSCVADLAKLLNEWFRIRFKKPFRYKLDNLPEWITAIIVSYGNAIYLNQSSQFVSNFYSWLDSIAIDPDKYSLPYDVYDFYKHPNNATDATSALILYDMLYDGGLKSVVRSDTSYMQDTAISDWACEHSIRCDSSYNYYGSQPELIKKYCIR